MESFTILEKGIAKKWQVNLANKAIEDKADGYIYQQACIGNNICVVHSCTNMGEPFNSSRHRASHAVWAAVKNIKSKPKSVKNWNDKVSKLRDIWMDSRHLAFF